MRLTTKLTTLAAGAALAAAVAAVAPATASTPAPAGEATYLIVTQNKTGTITGTIKDASGQPMGKVPVRLMAPPGSGGDQDGGGGDVGGLAMVPPPSIGNEIGKAVTDDQGKFKFPRPVEPGVYRIEAGNAVTGYGSKTVTVKAGEEAKAEIQLRAPERGNAAGGNGGSSGGRGRR